MTRNPTQNRAVFAVIGLALAATSLCAQAEGREHVVVVNTAANPVPVTGTVAVSGTPSVTVTNNSTNPVYVKAQSNEPYIVQEAVGDSSTCAPQCILTFPTVPAGKRLVITNVSSQIGSEQVTVVLEGNGVAVFAQKPYPTADYLSATVLDYYEAGTTPTARFFVPNLTQTISLIVTLSGHYEAVP